VDKTTIWGLITGIGMIMGGFLEEDGDPKGLLQISAAMIIFGGTSGVVLICFPMSEIKRAGRMLKAIFVEKEVDEISLIEQMVTVAEKARKDGILSLEEYVQSNELHPVFRKGLGLIVDGIEVQLVKEILEKTAALYEHQFHAASEVYEAAGGFCPTMGVVGTVLGLISVLGNISDPSTLGPKIALAFIATFMGIFGANVIFLPFAAKLKAKGRKEKELNDIIIEGLLSIQAGENPRVIKDKLNVDLLEKFK